MVLIFCFLSPKDFQHNAKCISVKSFENFEIHIGISKVNSCIHLLDLIMFFFIAGEFRFLQH